ncbi:MAG: type II toxin-antitoxin system RelE/ParE family toxin [Eubacteriales bacterium]
MNRIFCMLKAFEQSWAKMGLGDDDLAYLQGLLIQNPEAGAVMADSSGARKVRVPMDGRGKSGGGRVIYVDLMISEKIYLLFAYPKNEKENLDKKELSKIKQIVDLIKQEEGI